MDVMSVLKVAQKADIVLFKEGEPLVLKSVPCSVKNHKMEIKIPLPKRDSFIPEGNEIFVRVLSGNALYQFKEIIQNVVLSEINGVRKAILNISIPKKVQKIQRREYVRIDATIPMLIKAPCTVEIVDTLEQTGKVIQTETRDISGGGISFYCNENEEIEKDTELIISLKIPEMDTILAEGRVVRVVKEKDKTVIGVVFSKITDKDRRNIVKLVYHKQLETYKNRIHVLTEKK